MKGRLIIYPTLFYYLQIFYQLSSKFYTKTTRFNPSVSFIIYFLFRIYIAVVPLKYKHFLYLHSIGLQELIYKRLDTVVYIMLTK